VLAPGNFKRQSRLSAFYLAHSRDLARPNVGECRSISTPGDAPSSPALSGRLVLREPFGTRGTDWHRVSPCRIVGLVHGTTECGLARMFPTFPPKARNSCVAPDCHHSPTPSPSTHLGEKRSLPLVPRRGSYSPPQVVPALRLPVRVALVIGPIPARPTRSGLSKYRKPEWGPSSVRLLHHN
jgi:hypothetical protein